jgi:hypothetical protein
VCVREQVSANGETKSSVDRLSKLMQAGSPLVFLANTGGVTQAFAALHATMAQKKRSPDPQKLLKQLQPQLVQPQQPWTAQFGMNEITMVQELLAKDPSCLTTVVATIDALKDPADYVVSRVCACQERRPFEDPRAAAAAASDMAGGGEVAAPSGWRGKMGLLLKAVPKMLRKRKAAVSPTAGAAAAGGAAAVVGGAAAAGGMTPRDGGGVAASAGGMAAGDEEERLRKLFHLIDRDGTGGIDFEEFKAGIFLMGFLEKSDVDPPDETEMQTWFEDADADESGRLDFPEFVALCKVEMKPKRRERKKAERALGGALGNAPPAVPQPQPLPPVGKEAAAAGAAVPPTTAALPPISADQAAEAAASATK